MQLSFMAETCPHETRRFFRNAEVLLGPETCRTKPTGTLAFQSGAVAPVPQDIVVLYRQIFQAEDRAGLFLAPSSNGLDYFTMLCILD
jgi:hypothetical protein